MSYSKKYDKYKIKKLVGGCKIPHLNINDIESILNYINQHVNCAMNTTKNKYFVICYGPPASGKSIARKIACNLIKNIYNDETDISTIIASFIDTGVDDIIASTITQGSKPLKEILQKNIRDVIGDSVASNVEKPIVSYILGDI